MPEWSKGYDLRSYGESLVGSNPTPSKKKFLYIRKFCPNMIQTFAQSMGSDDMELLDFLDRKLDKSSEEDCDDAEISTNQHDIDEWMHDLHS